MANRPHADTELAKYLTRRGLELRPKTQADIATEAGFANANFLTMVKQGASKLAFTVCRRLPRRWRAMRPT
ncbi:hypothetical protein Rsw2DRAFT_0145 [Rhodobacter ferrooxidans]|uniref:HTH cro/C1-type domain-containing protein n=2 Tax=Rhodobacter ferrooxidans TaxID=371731 RepID=C8RWG7_9RHOB|nr:hypothetical protein Rsw2DRAFT_0145 [Rhodobacter sp. SW2]